MKSSNSNKNEEHKCLFDGKENFMSKTSKQVAESSKHAIYKRDSGDQQSSLQRVSVFEWRNMSQRWQTPDTLYFNDNDDDDGDDEKIINIHHRNSLNSVDSVEKSLNACHGKRRVSKALIVPFPPKKCDCLDDNINTINNLSEPKIGHYDAFDARRSRLFLLNIDDRSVDDDDKDHPSAVEKCNRSKSFLIAIESDNLLHDDDEEEYHVTLNSGM